MIKQIQILSLLFALLFVGCNKDDDTGPTTDNQAKITSLDCGGTTINGVLSSNTAEIIQNSTIANKEILINYSGGNGGTYSTINISSTGVTGLTATATSGNILNGNGTLKLNLNGTPTSYGDANFNISFGGINCSFVIKVQQQTIASTMTQKYFSSSSNGNLGYWLYTPQNPTANMPLIIYLHGGSFRGTDLSLLVGGSLPKFLYDSSVTNVPAYILMPQCPTGKVWEQIGGSIIEMIDNIVASKSINTYKISLTGHSLGGTGTWKLGATYSSKFSCIAPLSGSVVVSTASQYTGLPVYAFVGSDDTIVDPTSSITIVTSINSLGGNAQIKNYNGATHFDVPDLTYKDNSVNILNWMISKTK